MKYCLSARQEDQYLRKADEILFEFRDREAIFDYIDKYPEATIILSCEWLNEEINWAEMKAYNSKANGNFIIAITDIDVGLKAKENGIKFYHLKPVSNYYDLRALIDLGVYYVIPGAPLFFDMHFLTSYFKVKVRCYPNESNLDGLPREERVCGPWIRPENIDAYAKYVEAVEFKRTQGLDDAAWLKKEKGLFRVYHDEHEWPGEIDLIINDIGSKAVNRMIMPGIEEARLACRQKCMDSSNCKLCYTAFKLADPERIQGYVDSPKEPYDVNELVEEEEENEKESNAGE